MNIRTFSIGLAALLVSTGAATAAYAAAPPTVAVIEYASTSDVMVIRGLKPLTLDDPIGFELAEGDQVQTGRRTLVEIRLMSGAVLKLAENTTFVLKSVGAGGTSLTLVYGRLRAKVEKLTGVQSFQLSGESAIAGVRGTDFGMDVLAPRSKDATAPRTDVYCFEGSVMVTALVDALAGAQEGLESIPKQYVVSAGEMVSVQRTKTASEAIKSGIGASIQDFWNANDFSTEPGVMAPGAAAPVATATVPAPASGTGSAALSAKPSGAAVPEAAFEEGYDAGYLAARAALDVSGLKAQEELKAVRRAASRLKGGFVAGGFIVLTGVGLSIAGSVLAANGDAVMGSTFTTSGMVVTGLSLPFLILAFAVGP